MSCYHPMVLINTSDMTDPKQRQIVDLLKIRHKKDNKVKSVNTILIPRELALKEGFDLKNNNAVVVPCGRCIGCRLDYSRQWAVRIMKECEKYEFNYFLTLDYDDQHLPVHFVQDREPTASLEPDDVSIFMKRLRTKLKRLTGHDGVKFFACGEYGDKFGRPHLHIILMNCPLPDLTDRHPIPVDGQIKNIRQYDSDGNKLLYSPLLASCWTDYFGDRKGRSTLGLVTFESAAYVSRYVVKKLYGKDAEKYEEDGILPEFVRMSRNPGIGHDFFMDHFEEISKFDSFNIKRGDSVINMKPGKYFDKLLKLSDEQAYYDLKKKRHDDFYDHLDELAFSGIDLVINNHNGEYNKLHQAKTLKRKLA